MNKSTIKKKKKKQMRGVRLARGSTGEKRRISKEKELTSSTFALNHKSPN